MKLLLSVLLILIQSSPAFAQADAPSPSLQLLVQQLDADEKRLSDWPELARYRDDNARVPSPQLNEQRVVFLGDSITDFWGRGADRGEFFPDKPYINRGISAQTTPQILLRFRADVIALKPRAVVILAGTNDIAGNTGKATPEMIEDNFASISDLAQANGIKVILASILPVNNSTNPRETERRPPQRIHEINDWLRAYTARKGFVYLDYYTALIDANGAMKQNLSNDGLHPNTRGYALMAPLAQHAIEQALGH